jgi:hypothetical protein
MSCTILSRIAFTLLLATIIEPSLAGQAATEEIPTVVPPSDWQFRLEPYLWTPGLYGSVGVGRLDAEIDASTIDVLENVKMAAALQFEARYRRWGFIMDGFYADLGLESTTPGPLYDSVGVDLKQFIGELDVAYRVFDHPKGFVDIYAGVRYNNLSLDMDATLDVPGIQSVSDNTSARIVDQITQTAEAIIGPRVDEFQNASAARRDEIAAEIQAKVKAETQEQMKQTLLSRLKRIRSDGDFDKRDVALSRIIRGVKAERLELVRSNAELATARIRAAADEADAALQERLSQAQSRVAQAEADLSGAISGQLQNGLPTSASGDRDWVDPIVGVRAQWNFNAKWYAAGKSDIGGFGVGSDLTWSAQGTVGYLFTGNVSAEIGYRYLDTDYSDGDFSYDLAEHGLFVGLNLTF